MRLNLFLVIAALSFPAVAQASRGALDLKPQCSHTPLREGVLMPCVNEKINPSLPATFWEALKLMDPGIKPDDVSSTVGAQTFLTLDSPARLLLMDRQSGTLAYFRLEPSLKLLSSVSAAQDAESTLLTEIPAVEISPGRFVFAANSLHSNSAGHYDTYSLFLASPDRIDLVYEGPHLSSFAAPPPSDCYTQQSFKALTVLPAKTNGFPDLRMTVTEEKRCTKNGKEVPVKNRNLETVLKWDGKKYGGGSKLFGK